MTDHAPSVMARPFTKDEERQLRERWRGAVQTTITPRLLATLDRERALRSESVAVSPPTDWSVLRKQIRAAVSDAYYESRNDGETMEHAASVAAAAVITVLEGYAALHAPPALDAARLSEAMLTCIERDDFIDLNTREAVYQAAESILAELAATPASGEPAAPRSHPHDGYAYDGCKCVCCVNVRALQVGR